jgi:hypothetical protein
MDEYIKRSKLIEALEDQLEEHGNPDLDHQPIAYGSKLGITYGLALAKTFPAEDVVEVVRCKDCEYFNGEVCSLHSDPYGDFEVKMLPNDFCSHGEREN